MKIRRPKASGKVAIDMTPMIDCVFQLLIFFMLSLKIVEEEGDFSINMPIGAPSAAAAKPQLDIKVNLLANPDGSLARVLFGQNNLGNDAKVFSRLNQQIMSLVGGNRRALSQDTEVEIGFDYNLNYEFVMRAVSACTGRIEKSGDKTVLIKAAEKIKFAPPRRPK